MNYVKFSINNHLVTKCNSATYTMPDKQTENARKYKLQYKYLKFNIRINYNKVLHYIANNKRFPKTISATH